MKPYSHLLTPALALHPPYRPPPPARAAGGKEDGMGGRGADGRSGGVVREWQGEGGRQAGRRGGREQAITKPPPPKGRQGGGVSEIEYEQNLWT